jgi:hypothetical protein
MRANETWYLCDIHGEDKHVEFPMSVLAPEQLLLSLSLLWHTFPTYTAFHQISNEAQ